MIVPSVREQLVELLDGIPPGPTYPWFLDVDGCLNIIGRPRGCRPGVAAFYPLGFHLPRRWQTSHLTAGRVRSTFMHTRQTRT